MKGGFYASVLFCASLMGPGAASADDGLYFGAALGLSKSQSNSFFGSTSGDDLTIGALIGYRFELSSGSSISVEGTLDAASRTLMTYSFGTNACTDFTPDWCRVNGIARLRAVYGFVMADGVEVLAMAGGAAVAGIAEDGAGVYANTTAHGYTLGVGGQKETNLGMTRVELTYDRFDGSNPSAYDKTLDIVSLRAILTF